MQLLSTLKCPTASKLVPGVTVTLVLKCDEASNSPFYFKVAWLMVVPLYRGGTSTRFEYGIQFSPFSTKNASMYLSENTNGLCIVIHFLRNSSNTSGPSLKHTFLMESKYENFCTRILQPLKELRIEQKNSKTLFITDESFYSKWTPKSQIRKFRD